LGERRKKPNMKQSNEGSRGRRYYDEAFKQEAVRSWQQSGRAAVSVARELGLSAHQLYRWHVEQGGQAGRAPRAAGAPGLPVGEAELQAEVLRLREELARVSEQRDILKKSTGILSEAPRSGMPGLKR
jgi:transposase